MAVDQDDWTIFEAVRQRHVADEAEASATLARQLDPETSTHVAAAGACSALYLAPALSGTSREPLLARLRQAAKQQADTQGEDDVPSDALAMALCRTLAKCAAPGQPLAPRCQAEANALVQAVAAVYARWPYATCPAVLIAIAGTDPKHKISEWVNAEIRADTWSDEEAVAAIWLAAATGAPLSERAWDIAATHAGATWEPGKAHIPVCAMAALSQLCTTAALQEKLWHDLGEIASEVLHATASDSSSYPRNCLLACAAITARACSGVADAAALVGDPKIMPQLLEIAQAAEEAAPALPESARIPKAARGLFSRPPSDPLALSVATDILAFATSAPSIRSELGKDFRWIDRACSALQAAVRARDKPSTLALCAAVHRMCTRRDASSIPHTEADFIRMVHGQIENDVLPVEALPAIRSRIAKENEGAGTLAQVAAKWEGAAREEAVETLAALAEEPSLAGVLAASGAARALAGAFLDRRAAARGAPPPASEAAAAQVQPHVVAAQALAKVLIRVNPALVTDAISAATPLISLLDDSHELRQFEACMALTNLASVSEEMCAALSARKIWDALVPCLTSENIQVVRAAIELFTNMMMDADFYERLVKDAKHTLEVLEDHRGDGPGTLFTRMRMLCIYASQDDAATQEASLGALANALTSDASIAEAAVALGVLPILLLHINNGIHACVHRALVAAGPALAVQKQVLERVGDSPSRTFVPPQLVAKAAAQYAAPTFPQGIQVAAKQLIRAADNLS